jgi:Hemagglutinin repeat
VLYATRNGREPKNRHFSDADIEKSAIEYVVSTKGSRMQALAAVNSGFAVKGAVDAVQGAGAAGAVGLTIAVSLGSSKSQSNTDSSANTGVASTVKAGGNVTITATGADNTKGETSNITIQGSQIQAGQTTTLDAQDNLNLLASRNTTTQSNSSSNSSSSVGVSFGIGAGTTGVGFNVAAARGKGAGAGSEVIYNNTLIEGNTVNLRSGKDTNLIGAVVKGTTVNADIGNNPFGSGGNLRIESLQDTSVYNESSQNSGGTLSISAAGVPGGSVTSGSTKIDSNFVSVGQQSAIRAGDGGFNVNVAGKSDLIGGQITSTQKAVDDNKNSFETKGPLTVTNLANAATYSATGSSVTIGIGSELASSGAGAGKATGNANSTTEAAITGVAGNKTARTGDKEAGLQPIFNLEAVKLDVATQIEITKKFGQNASKAVGDFAAEQLKKAQDSGDQAEIDKWKEGGISRVALHTLVGALGGGLKGAVGAATSQTVIPLLGAQIAQLDIPVELKQVLVQVAAVAVGAATGGTAGVAAAVNATGQNYLTHTELKSRAQNASACKQGNEKACQAVREIDKKSVDRNTIVDGGVLVATPAQAAQIVKDLQTTMSGLQNYKVELQNKLDNTSDPAQRADLQNQINLGNH